MALFVVEKHIVVTLRESEGRKGQEPNDGHGTTRNNATSGVRSGADKGMDKEIEPDASTRSDQETPGHAERSF